MGLFNFLFTKKLSGRKLRNLLREINILSPEEREYVEVAFRKYESGGITKSEVEQVVRDLKFDTMDPINREEAEAIRRKLLDNL